MTTLFDTKKVAATFWALLALRLAAVVLVFFACLKSGAETLIFCGDDGTHWTETRPDFDDRTGIARDAIAPSPVGEQRTLVVSLAYRDKEPSHTPTKLYEIFLGSNTNSVNEVAMEQSRGKAWYSVTVVGPFEIDFWSTNSCNIDTIRSLATSVCIANGVNPGNYHRIVYYMPLLTNCAFAGTGTLCGSPSHSWINGDRGMRMFGVASHEVTGHNFGLHHASSDWNNDSFFDTGMEYGDTSSIMGFGAWTFNAPNAWSLTWMPDAHLLTVTNGGTFTIASFGSPNASASLPEIVRFPRTSNSWYSLSYRTPVGFSANIGQEHMFKVFLHHFDFSRWTYCRSRTYHIKTISAGESIVVTKPTNVTFRVVSAGASSATIEIEFGGELPPPPPPPQPVWPSFAAARAGQTPIVWQQGAFTGQAPFAVVFTNKTVGPAIAYSWSFEPGRTSTQRDPTHTYTNAGTFTPSLQAFAADGLPSSFHWPGLITVLAAPPITPPPVAGFHGNPTLGAAPLTVTFTDSSTGSITNRNWSFGDGSSANGTGLSVLHSYNTARTNTVRLIVSGSGGTSTNIKASYITVTNTPVPPQVDTPPTVPCCISFSYVGNGANRQLKLTWGASTDDKGVSGYNVYMDGTIKATVSGTSWQQRIRNSNLPGMHTFTVRARDTIAQLSAPSVPQTITVPNK